MNALILQFIFGLGSSLHCVGMCGPLNFILPLEKEDKVKILFELIVYHSGRIMVYAFIGIAIAMVSNFFAIKEIQSYVAFVFGFMLLLYGLNYFIGLKIPLYFSKGQYSLLKLYNGLLKSNSKQNLFFLGTLNGLLPCGMVYAAMAISFLNNQIAQGALMMMAFGIGTVPALLAFVVGSRNKSFRTLVNKYPIQPTLMIVAGVFVCLKSTTNILTPQTALWQSILSPIMCH